MPDTTLLKSTLLFQHLNDDELDDIAGLAEETTLRRGDVIFAEADEPDHLYIVVSGRIAIANKSIDGRESMVARHGARRSVR